MHRPGAQSNADSVLQKLARDAKLTPTLIRRLREVSQGMTYKEIARANDISVNTVKTQVGQVLSTMGLTSRYEIENALRAARLRAGDGASEADLLAFFRTRFE